MVMNVGHQEWSVGGVKREGGIENVVNIVLIDEILPKNGLKYKNAR